MRYRHFKTTREKRTTWVVQDTIDNKEIWLARLGDASGARHMTSVLNDRKHPRHESALEMFNVLAEIITKGTRKNKS